MERPAGTRGISAEVYNPILEYYKDLYRVNSTKSYMIQEFYGVKQFWDDNALYFFSYYKDYKSNETTDFPKHW